MYADEPMVIAPAPTSSYSVVIENNTLDLGGETVYELNKHMMVPLRTVAEKLGFKVKWDGEHQGISLDNGEVNTIVYLLRFGFLINIIITAYVLICFFGTINNSVRVVCI